MSTPKKKRQGVTQLRAALKAAQSDVAKLRGELAKVPTVARTIKSTPKYRAMVAAVREWLQTIPNACECVEISAVDRTQGSTDTLASFSADPWDAFTSGDLAALEPPTTADLIALENRGGEA